MGIPLVTVIVPSYNHKRFIIQCLDSIKNQTYTNIQWIVVDDGSKDGSQELLKEKQSYYGYELFLQENKGLSATLTDMIKNHGKGKYVACCASDDAWLPDKIKIQVEYMEEHPEFAMCFGRAYYIDPDSNFICDDKTLAKDYRGGWVFEEIITQKFHPPVNYMIRRDVIAEMGYYPQGVIAEDFYLNCKIAHKYEIGYIADFLSYYRVIPTNAKRDPYKLVKSHEDTIRMYKGEKIYKKAMGLQNLRVFCNLSRFTKYKLLALKYGIYSFPLFYNKLYLIAVYRMLFSWQRLYK